MWELVCTGFVLLSFLNNWSRRWNQHPFLLHHRSVFCGDNSEAHDFVATSKVGAEIVLRFCCNRARRGWAALLQATIGVAGLLLHAATGVANCYYRVLSGYNRHLVLCCGGELLPSPLKLQPSPREAATVGCSCCMGGAGGEGLDQRRGRPAWAATGSMPCCALHFLQHLIFVLHRTRTTEEETTDTNISKKVTINISKR